MKTKYIGISGHRGSGRSTFTYLLANTIEWMNKHPELTSQDNIPVEYYFDIGEWFHNIRSDVNFLNNYNCSQDMYISSFSSTMKYMVSQILGVDYSFLKDERYKDNIYINIKDFHTTTIRPDDKDIITLDEYICGSLSSEDVYISLRDFYIYIYTFVFKENLGNSIWVKIIDRESKYFEELLGPYKYKIYWDMKSREEYEFIKNNNGVCIYLNRLKNTNKSSVYQLDDMIDQFDHVINIDEYIGGLTKYIWTISKQITQND